MDILRLWCNHNNVMQLLLRVCSVDRVRTIQCSMPEVGKQWPTGQMWPDTAFSVARRSIQENLQI